MKAQYNFIHPEEITKKKLKDIHASSESSVSSKEQTDKLQMETKRNVDATKEKIERRENLNKESFLFFIPFFIHCQSFV